MKKVLLTILVVALFVCALAVSVSADDVVSAENTYYLVQSTDSALALSLQEEGKNVKSFDELLEDMGDNDNGVATTKVENTFLSQFDDGEVVKLIFAESIYTENNLDYNCVLINTAITVIVDLNGYTHYVTGTNDKGVGARINCFAISNPNATLKLYGSKAYNENGEVDKVDPTFQAPTYTEENGVSGGNLDVYHPKKVYVWAFDGNVYVEGVRSYTSEELVYTGEGGTNPSDGNYDTYELKDCVLGSNTTAIGLLGKGNARKIVKSDNCYINKFIVHTVMTGSVMKNTTFKEVHLDGWDVSGQIWAFECCTVDKITTESGRTHLTFTDCNLEKTSWSLKGDGGGDQFVRIYTSPTCTKAGAIELKRSTNKGSNNPYEDEVNNYNVPALGHTVDTDNITGVTYVSYLDKGTYVGLCNVCGEVGEHNEATANPLIVFHGYSAKENNTAICADYTVEYDLLALYKAYSKKELTFGVVACASDNLVNKDNKPINSDGYSAEVTSGNIVNSAIENIRSGITVKLQTTDWSNFADKNMILCAYIIENGNVGYICNKTAITAEGLPITYNQIVGAVVGGNEE